MKKGIRRSIASMVLLSAGSLAAQTDNWNNGGDGVTWSQAANWSNGAPTSTSLVVILDQPTANLIGVDTGPLTPVASFTFSNNLTGSVSILPNTNDSLLINGPITNSSGFADTFSLEVTMGANATIAGGTAGLDFGILSIGTNTVATTGTVAASSQLIFEIDRTGSTVSQGSIGNINATGASITIGSNLGNTITAADAGDIFHVAKGSNGFNGNLNGANSTVIIADPLPGGSGLVFATGLVISHGIVMIQPTNGNVIQSGVILPIDNDSEFNGAAGTAGITFEGPANPTATTAAEIASTTTYASTRAITMTGSGTLAAATNTTATYSGTISGGGALTIGDTTVN